jgi:hypothetical protein
LSAHIGTLVLIIDGRMVLPCQPRPSRRDSFRSLPTYETTMS